MNAKDVKARVETIAAQKGDPEAAHSAADSLYVDVLRSISEGTARSPRALATAALAVEDLKLTRWYA